MSYVDRHLLPNEAVTYKTTLHWKVYVWPVLVSVILCAPLAVLALRSEHKPLAIAPVLLAVALIGAAFVRRGSSEYAVTTKRVIVKVGVMQTRSVELLLGKVEGITVTQGLMGKLFGYGEIVITGSGGTKEPFAGIQAPFDFRRAVQAATDGGSA
ncbi:MAG: PH domain-containing protein [Gemmatimonadaceae bacterium]